MKYFTIQHKLNISKAKKGIPNPKVSKALKDYFALGHRPWNYGLEGIHLSLKSEFKKGYKSYKRTLKHRIKMHNAVPKGDLHYRWKGGKKSRSKHYDDLRLRNWREKVFKRDNWTCRVCQSRGKKLQAHHKKSWIKFLKDRFKLNNGLTLCLNCHKRIHGYNKHEYSR